MKFLYTTQTERGMVAVFKADHGDYEHLCVGSSVYTEHVSTPAAGLVDITMRPKYVSGRATFELTATLVEPEETP